MSVRLALTNAERERLRKLKGKLYSFGFYDNEAHGYSLSRNDARRISDALGELALLYREQDVCKRKLQKRLIISVPHAENG